MHGGCMGAWETGGPATCVGVWLEVAGAVVAVGLVDDEGCGGSVYGALCLRGLCRWRSRLVVRVCARAFAWSCVPTRVWSRTLKDRRLGSPENG